MLPFPDSLNFTNAPGRGDGVSYVHFAGEGFQDLERLSDMFKVTQVINGKVKTLIPDFEYQF